MCKIFLDDVREPKDCLGYMYQRIGPDNFLYLDKDDWIVVRNYDEFIQAVEQHLEKITHVSFDHDLSDEHYDPAMDSETDYNELYKTFKEKTGKECAEWMKAFYKSQERELPVLFVHSMNSVGTQNIINVFKS